MVKHMFGGKGVGISWRVCVMDASEMETSFRNRGRKERGGIYEEIVVVLQEFDAERKARRVISRGKHWLTVYRAQQVEVELAWQKGCKWFRKMKISQNL